MYDLLTRLLYGFLARDGLIAFFLLIWCTNYNNLPFILRSFDFGRALKKTKGCRRKERKIRKSQANPLLASVAFVGKLNEFLHRLGTKQICGDTILREFKNMYDYYDNN